MSSSRPSTWSRPSSSNRPASAVRNQPSTSTSAVRAGSPSYPSNSVGPPIRIRPSAPIATADAVEREPVVDAAAGGLGRAVGRHDPDAGRRVARSRSARSTGPPPTSTAAHRGERRRVVRRPERPDAAGSRRGRRTAPRPRPRPPRPATRGRPAAPAGAPRPASDRPPATPRRTSSAAPAPTARRRRAARPSRRTDASTARRDSTTRLGCPVDPDVSTTIGSGSAGCGQPGVELVDGRGEKHATNASHAWNNRVGAHLDRADAASEPRSRGGCRSSRSSSRSARVRSSPAARCSSPTSSGCPRPRSVSA